MVTTPHALCQQTDQLRGHRHWPNWHCSVEGQCLLEVVTLAQVNRAAVRERSCFSDLKGGIFIELFGEKAHCGYIWNTLLNKQDRCRMKPLSKPCPWIFTRWHGQQEFLHSTEDLCWNCSMAWHRYQDLIVPQLGIDCANSLELNWTECEQTVLFLPKHPFVRPSSAVQFCEARLHRWREHVCIVWPNIVEEARLDQSEEKTKSRKSFFSEGFHIQFLSVFM